MLMGMFDFLKRNKGDDFAADLKDQGMNDFSQPPPGNNPFGPSQSQNPNSPPDPLAPDPNFNMDGPLGSNNSQQNNPFQSPPQMDRQPSIDDMRHNPSDSFPPARNDFPQQGGYQEIKEEPSRREDAASINLSKDIEIVSAKLDAIKAELDSMNQRMKRMESRDEMQQERYSSRRDKWNY
jgi:hypothetical protein